MQTFYLRLLIATILAIVLYVLMFHYVDRPIALAAAPLANTVFYKISYVLYRIFKPSIWALISLIGFVVFLITCFAGRRSKQLNGLAFICASNLLGSLICEIIKVGLARYRPVEFLTQQHYGFHFFSMQDNLNSTPSGHAMIVFSMAMCLTVLFRRYAIWFFLVAFMVAVSRIVMAHHFLGDVFLGAYVGIVASLIIRHHFMNKLK